MPSRLQAAADLYDLYVTQAFEEAATFLWNESLEHRVQERRRSPAPEEVATMVRLGLAKHRCVLANRLLCLEHNMKAVRSILAGRSAK
jgi:hypothetical protein